ncbi:hypothetical protein JWG45_17895 [Leptospira sp. 201903070]|uniref:DUF481 domain-containing protein n=1 Tax=Leptospira ainlahdjerensis TaxID=2810033 RepID=A0ABS2UHJ7_9LEPT|nr:hypothetical protein [Leptospira ainlahdjerensis]MBM9579023.1 hypothetical protein [Leptospira ainlahdjerensis]
MNSKCIIFFLILFLCVFDLLGENLYLNSPEPKDRLAVSLSIQRQESLDAKKETITGALHAEKKIGIYVSLFAILPYQRLRESGERKSEHWNQQQAGIKFFLPLGDAGLAAVGGSSYYFATGKERLGIGSEKFGNIEFSGGLFYRNGPWALFGITRWNSQTTPYLRERQGEQFEKAWYFDFWFSYTYKSFEYIFEATRKVLYDPQREDLYSTVLSPGLMIHLKSLSFGVAVPFTVSRSYVPDGTLARPETTFQRDDFDRGILFKSFKYF